MSFFGLTAFGPENYLKAKQIDNNGKEYIFISFKDLHCSLMKILKELLIELQKRNKLII